ncbi:hypothetical protein RJ639_013907 [Escallonia herrerae]|uniref:Uncharacterized protein n=1 Tax=Escallonia herrerae TaxID=1293975 RepID=A0AA88VHW5_9ASTE|nr:hypothetical protein RJ639_013907 [Escallonia herrerae]
MGTCPPMGLISIAFGSSIFVSEDIFANDSIKLLRQCAIDFKRTIRWVLIRADTQAGFSDLLNVYFPVVYDIKYLMKFCNSLHDDLNKLAELLEVERIGVCH